MLALAAGIAAIAAALPAGAHVRLSPRSVAGGIRTDLTFRCPTERSNTPTVKLVVQVPVGASLGTVSVPPKRGWRVRIATRGRAIDTITWEGGSIPPGSFATFVIHAGPLPAGPQTLFFRAIQTYGDGEVVRWIEERAPGEGEPPFPAPALTVR
jgi:uncharacterized protein YcnI